MAKSKLGHLLHELLESDHFGDFENCYNNSKSCEEIFSCFWGIEEVHKILTITLAHNAKSEAEADKLRNEGNDAYKKKELRDALRMYNMSIMAAPHPVLASVAAPNEANDDEDCLGRWIDPAKYGGVAPGESIALAMGYANRSAVMFELGAYDECLRDIELAFEYGYPEDTVKKLETRKERSLAAKEKASQLPKSPSKQKAEVEDEGADNAIAALAANLGKAHLPATASSPELNFPFLLKYLLGSPEHIPPTIAKENEHVPCLSSSVKLTYEAGKGRHLTATRNIATGEVIGVERAYSVGITPPELSEYCSTCLRRCRTPLPCPACTMVIFCSSECRTKGLAEEHWIECCIMPTMISMEIFNKNLAFKMLKNADINEVRRVLKSVKEVNQDRPEMSGCNQNMKYLTRSYHTIQHLCSNMEQQSFKLMFTRCQIAFIITKLLVLSERFFVDEAGQPYTPSEDDIVTTGGIVLSHAIKLNYNPYEILDLQLKKPIAAGIFPSLSLINHSCNPSVKHYSCNRYIVIRTMKAIKAGEEVTDSYTKDFSEEAVESRAKFLKSYFIQCTCEACQNQWPMYDALPTLVFSCLRCSQPVSGANPMCPDCYAKASPTKTTPQAVKEQQERAQVVWNAIYRALRVGMHMANTETISDGDLKLICNTIDLLPQHVVLPCQTLVDLQNILLKAFELGK